MHRRSQSNATRFLPAACGSMLEREAIPLTDSGTVRLPV